MAEMILPGTYIEVRPEGLIAPGQITVGNIGVVGTAAFLGLRRYFGTIRRRRLGEFINPYTGELTVPGGPKPLRWIALFRRS